MLRNRKSADRSITGMPLDRSGPATADDKVCGRARKATSNSADRSRSIFPKETPASFPLNGGNACSSGCEEYCSEVRTESFTPGWDRSSRISSKPVYPVAPKIATRFIRFPILPIV